MFVLYPVTANCVRQLTGSFLFLLIFLLISLSASAQSNNFGWAKSYGGTGLDQGRSIQADNNGFTYVTGAFQDSLAFDTTGIVLHSQGGSDALLAKFKPNGQALWALSIGSTAEEMGLKVSLDKLGHLYITGSFSGPDLSLGSYTLTNTDTTGTDVFLAKYDTTGVLLWAKSYGAAAADLPTALGTDDLGNSYLSGFFSAASIAFDTTTLASSGEEDFFLAKHDPAGNLLWAVRNGTVLNDRSSALAVDSLGNCLLTGFFTGDSLFFAADTLTRTDSLAYSDIFLLKYDPDGQELWANSAGSDTTDLSTGLVLDADGYSYLTGITTGSELLFDSVKVTNTASQALFLIRVNPEGDAEWERSAEVTGEAGGWELTADAYGYMYLMTDFNGQLQLENTTYQHNTGSRLVFTGYTIFQDFSGSKQATGTGTARGFSIHSSDEGLGFATGAFTDSLFFDSLAVTVPADSLLPMHQNMFVTSLNPSGNGSGGGGGSGPGGPAVCHIPIREVLPSCGAIGDEVLIRGIFRGRPSAVSFGGIPAQIVNKTLISVTAIVPAGYTGGPVAITVNGCTDTAYFGLTPVITATASAQGLCAGSPLTLTATGADFYNWSSGQADSIITVSPDVPTTYTVTGTIAACSATASVVVDVDTILASFTVIAPAQPICEGSSVTLTAQGATSYSWSNGHLSDTLTLTPAASQTLYVIGNAGACTDTVSVALTVVPVPVVTLSPANSVICHGDSVTLTASGAYAYSWWGFGSDSTFTVSPDSSATYTVTGFNFSCADTAFATIQVHPQVQLPVITGSINLCEGETLQLTASGGVSNFSWSGPGGFSSNQPVISIPNATAAHSGVYSVQPIDSTCQSAAATVQVQVNPVPVVTVSPQTQTVLPGATVYLTASGAATYIWQPGSDTTGILSVTPANTTQYLVTGTTAGCSDTASATVIVAPLLVTTGPDIQVCGQNSAMLSASISPAHLTGTWSVLSGTGGSFSDVSSPTATFTGQFGQYYMLQWQANGAMGPAASATMEVYFGQTPALPQAAPVAVCENATAHLVATGAAHSFTWYQQHGGPVVAMGSSFLTPPVTTETVYYVTARNAECETAPVAVPIRLHPNPDVEAGPDETIVAGNQVRLHATGAATYSWSPAEGLSLPQAANPFASPANTTTYTVTGFSEHGCPATDWLTITVLPLIQPANIFTPNGDGINDYWDIAALTELYPNCRVEVLTRWGKSVFSSKGYSSPWNGKFNGNDLPEGTYFYSIDPGNGHEPIRGMVVLGR